MTSSLVDRGIIRQGLSDRDAWTALGSTAGTGTTMLTGRPGTIRQLTYPIPNGELIMEVEGEPPPWLEATVGGLVRLLYLPPGWDSYGAKPVDPMTVWAALELMRGTMGDETPAPTVVPTSRGGVQFEWHTGGIDIEIEFRSANTVFVSFEDAATGEEWEYDVSANLTPLVRFIDRLQARGMQP